MLIIAFALYERLLGSLAAGEGVDDYLSYVTVQTNLIGAVVFGMGAVFALARNRDPRWFTLVRAGAVSYLAAMAVLYLGIYGPGALVGGFFFSPTNQIMHIIIPAFAIIDWTSVRGRTRLPWTAVAVIMAYPVAWIALTVVRGAITGWYPYEFLDPQMAGGPGRVAVFAGLILVTMALLAWGAVAINRRATRPRVVPLRQPASPAPIRVERERTLQQ
ncbi:Pr6Pr family membrane protein [Rathayibacter sp. YIM 133350]|uniref:Pr6Pr family membrane protein n=1 Tax=Rathayibacter sp. YIM 133350 TaxID=3131992 RepID=UPI00307F32D7